MIVTCPACATRYIVDSAALRATGRTVRCVRCAKTWHQDPSPPETPVLQPVTPSSLVGGGTPMEPQLGAIDVPIQPFHTQLPAIPRRRVSAVQLGWAGLCLFLVVLIGGLGLYRTQVIAAWPPTARLYAAVGWAPPPSPPAYEIRHTKGSDNTADGHRTIAISGEVANISQDAQPAPKMRLTLAGTDNKILKVYDFAIEHGPIQPGESVPFSYVANDAPSQAAPRPNLSIVTN